MGKKSRVEVCKFCSLKHKDKWKCRRSNKLNHNDDDSKSYMS